VINLMVLPGHLKHYVDPLLYFMLRQFASSAIQGE